ncbi:MAG: NnrS family protein [Spirochaetia bacterium]|nr:NnrS family protein [Spirochaetia bacterium]
MKYLFKNIKEPLSHEETNNYKLIFPFALPGFLLGTGIWLFDLDYSFQRMWHPYLLIHSMLFPIVLGFLWTGIPRFIASVYPSQRLKITYVILLLLNLASFSFQSIFLYKLFMFISYAGLLFWFFGFIRKRKVSPPAVLSFLFAALFAGFLGTGIIFLSEFMHIPQILKDFGFNQHRYVFFILLITAVGSRMIPVIEQKQITGKERLSISSLKISRHPYFWYINSLIIYTLLSIPVQIHTPAVSIIRVLVFLFIAKEIWYLFNPGKNRDMAAGFLILIQFILIISPLIHLISGISMISSFHFFFIGVLFLTVMIISARVVLSHGGYGLRKEKKSLYFSAAYGIVICAMLLRTFSEYFFQWADIYRISIYLLLASTALWLLEIFHSVFFERKTG